MLGLPGRWFVRDMTLFETGGRLRVGSRKLRKVVHFSAFETSYTHSRLFGSVDVCVTVAKAAFGGVGVSVLVSILARFACIADGVDSVGRLLISGI